MKYRFWFFLLSLSGLMISFTVNAQDDDDDETKEERRARREEVSRNYGTNIVRLYPVRILDADGIGLGMEYEKIVGANRNIGINLPLTFIIGFDSYSYDPTIPNENRANYFYFSPGLKFYPFGQRKVTYAVGPTFLFGVGNGRESYYDPMTGNVEDYYKFNVTRFGVMANNYLNIQLTEKFCFGVEAGLGVRYFNEEVRKPGGTYRNGPTATGNFALSFGYRF